MTASPDDRVQIDPVGGSAGIGDGNSPVHHSPSCSTASCSGSSLWSENDDGCYMNQQ